MAIQEVRVKYKGRDIRGEEVAHEVQRTIGIPGLEKVRTTRVYRLEGVTEEGAQKLADILLAEPLVQQAKINEPLIVDAPHLIEVAYNPGVMNPEVASIIKSAQDLGIDLTAADSSTEYGFYGNVTEEQVKQIARRLLVNKTVERIVTEKPDTLVIQGEVGPVNIISVREASTEELMILSKDKLFLNPQEMQVIQDYFQDLGRDPSDCELEIIAARWSEHCGHKTFKAKVLVDGQEKQPLFTRITETSKKYFGDEVVSAFDDNSGVITFYDGQAICFKVETHNSPSAIEPYGGAMTGSGGVFRDVLGTGQGARVLVSTDMFCFAPTDIDPSKLPPGTLHPDYLQRRIVAGVRDYGNRMGIPTNNGSVHYHEDFRAKPTVIVGTGGMIEESRAQKGEPQVNDLVISIGGRTGRDGIHGATFSSGEMTDRTININSSAVQIGNAIEEKRMADAILEARDLNLIRAITDCGAAGFSSAIGELGEDVGVTVDISRAPLKYPGLAPWEIWLSESQERMVLAVDPAKAEEFLAVCKKYNVEACILGHFDGSHRLTVKYGDTIVANLDYNFLKHGLPQRVMEANWGKPDLDDQEPELPSDWVGTIKRVLAHGNVCSKEPIVRQYDHGVQGTNALPPFGGEKFDGPNDAVIVTPILGKKYGMVVSHGMNPILNRIDPYEGSKWAIAEAMANYVAVGGDPDTSAWINNYIWPFPDKRAMGSLDRSVDAVVDAMDAFQRPVVSGKDSLSSTYRDKDGQVIEIPPVLCMSVFGKIPDVEKTITSDIKKPGSTLVLVGELNENMGGSIYYDINGLVGNEVPEIDLKTLPTIMRTVHQSIKSGHALACHDVSEGGVITTVAEMCFGGDCGVELDIGEGKADKILFSETAGCFVVEVENEKMANQLFANVPHQVLGKTRQNKFISVKQGDINLFDASIDELKYAWQDPIRRIFH
ncbi:MAG: phosphoribosylformylglycinamidine synthase subunit PurL [Candidatus Daviesbacteria bacterium]|nr:phosphoribosylformylglycinamidine synthase subunit PurL [Candidatus Daviesbacteria bacterium]